MSYIFLTKKQKKYCVFRNKSSPHNQKQYNTAMKNLMIILVISLLHFANASAGTMITFTRPGFTTVNAMGYSNGLIVGFSESNQGFIYDSANPDPGTAWTNFGTITIDGTTYNNRPRGLDGQYIVGQAANNQIGYYTTGSSNGAPATSLGNNLPQGISGSTIVGSTGTSMFIYDINTSTQEVLKHPSNIATKAWDIDNGLVVGEYGANGFIYDISLDTWATINFPGADRTNVQGISGNYLSGFYITAEGTFGYFYNFLTNIWTTIENPDPGSKFLQARSIEVVEDIITVVGSYRPLVGNDIGFIYTIPEPSSFALLAFTALGFISRRRR